MKRLAMPPLAPRWHHSRAFGCSIYELHTRALANRAVELINFDRAAAALPEAGQMFRR